jgi:hypothetical protein
MPVDFHYVPVSGALSGEAFEKQTERAFNELGEDIDEAREDAREAIDIATEAKALAVNALNATDSAIAAATTAQGKADAALSAASDATVAAQAAGAKADNAANLAAAAGTKADNAEAAADAAGTNAQAAKSTAEAARDTADLALSVGQGAEDAAERAMGLFRVDDETLNADTLVDPDKLYLTNPAAASLPLPVPAWLAVCSTDDGLLATQRCWGEDGVVYTRTASVERPDEDESNNTPVANWNAWRREDPYAAWLATPTMVALAAPWEFDYSNSSGWIRAKRGRFMVTWLAQTGSPEVLRLPDYTDSDGDGVPDLVNDKFLAMLVTARLEYEIFGLRSPFDTEGRKGGGWRIRAADVICCEVRPANDDGTGNAVAFDLLYVFSFNGQQLASFSFRSGVGNLGASTQHEMSHGLQYAYSLVKGSWWQEGTARWFENALGVKEEPRKSYAELIRMCDDPETELYPYDYDNGPRFFYPVASLYAASNVVIPENDAVLGLRYSDGSPVMRDFRITGAHVYKRLLEKLADAEQRIQADLGWPLETRPATGNKTWSEADQRSALNQPYVVQACRELIEESGAGTARSVVEAMAESLDSSIVASWAVRALEDSWRVIPWPDTGQTFAVRGKFILRWDGSTGEFPLPDYADSDGDGVPDLVSDCFLAMLVMTHVLCDVFGLKYPFYSTENTMGAGFWQQRAPEFLLGQVRPASATANNGVSFSSLTNLPDIFGTGSGPWAANMRTSFQPLLAQRQIIHCIRMTYTQLEVDWFRNSVVTWMLDATQVGAALPKSFRDLLAICDEPSHLYSLTEDSEAAEYFWSPLARLYSGNAAAMLTPNSKILRLTYSDGTPVMRDFDMYGGFVFKRLLEKLAKAETAARTALGITPTAGAGGNLQWPTADRQGADAYPYVLQAARELIEESAPALAWADTKAAIGDIAQALDSINGEAV